MKPSRTSLVMLAVLVLAISAASTWWAGRHEASLGEQVAALVQPGDIRMLSSETCSVCVVARAWFAEHRVAYSECTIERDAACKAAFEATQAPGTPVLMVRGRPLVGFNPERLRDSLHARG